MLFSQCGFHLNFVVKLLQSMNFLLPETVRKNTTHKHATINGMFSNTHTYVRIYCTLFSAQCTDKII